MNITTVGVDLAKIIFQIHGVDARGKVALRKQLKRSQVVGFFNRCPRIPFETGPRLLRRNGDQWQVLGAAALSQSKEEHDGR